MKVGEHGEILVDEHLRTSHSQIWAAGDVTGHPQFGYAAAAHGALVVDNAFGQPRGPDAELSPPARGHFTRPGIAAAGLTAAQTQRAGYDCECRILPLEHVPGAVVNRDTRGLVKLVAERGTGRLLGAHVLAKGAGDVIAIAGYGPHNQMTLRERSELWCPYLTMAEGLELAAQIFTRDATELTCCAA